MSEALLFDIDELDSINITPSIEVKEGDIWQLGRHRLLCGDCTIKDNISLLMDGKKADMVFTDPPYGVDYSSKNQFLNSIDKGNCIQIEIKNDNLSINKLKELWINAFSNFKYILNEYNSYYICSAELGIMAMAMAMEKAGIPHRHTLIWNKNNHVLGRSDYNYKHEPILYGWLNKHRFYGNGFFKTTVWDIAKPLKNDKHPTMKPVKLIENAILNCTLENMIIYDCFLGSGSTLIACEYTNRICYGMEIEPHYCSVIIERWQKYTNKKAIKIN